MRSDRFRHTLDWLRSLQPRLPCPGPGRRKPLKEMTSTEGQTAKRSPNLFPSPAVRANTRLPVETFVCGKPGRGRTYPLLTPAHPQFLLSPGALGPAPAGSGFGGVVCIRERVCVRRRAKTWLLQNLFKGRWKPLQQLPGEALVSEEEEVVAAKEWVGGRGGGGTEEEEQQRQQHKASKERRCYSILTGAQQVASTGQLMPAKRLGGEAGCRGAGCLPFCRRNTSFRWNKTP